jgi:hypothetical protein
MMHTPTCRRTLIVIRLRSLHREGMGSVMGMDTRTCLLIALVPGAAMGASKALAPVIASRGMGLGREGEEGEQGVQMVST